MITFSPGDWADNAEGTTMFKVQPQVQSVDRQLERAGSPPGPCRGVQTPNLPRNLPSGGPLLWMPEQVKCMNPTSLLCTVDTNNSKKKAKTNVETVQTDMETFCWCYTWGVHNMTEEQTRPVSSSWSASWGPTVCVCVCLQTHTLTHRSLLRQIQSRAGPWMKISCPCNTCPSSSSSSALWHAACATLREM